MTRLKISALAVFAALIATIALAHSDGIYNPTANNVGNFEGIDSNAASGSTLACTYTPVTTGTQNVAYTGATPSASGGVPAYTFSETGSLPTGVTLNTANGVLSGTPSVSGTFTGIQVKVADTVPTTVNCGASFTLVISAPAYQGPGDVVSGAVAFYSCRAYSAAKAGTKAYRIVRASDSTQTDINSLANGLCDTTTPATFCTATTCNYVTWYDQSGALACAGSTACDLSVVAGTAAWTASSLGGFPCPLSAGATRMSSAAGLTQAQPVTFGAIAERTAGASGTARIITTGTNAQRFSFTSPSGSFALNFGTSLVSTGSTEPAFHALMGIGNGASSSIVVDNAIPTGGSGNAGSTGLSGGDVFLFDDNSGGTILTGTICEAFIYPSGFNATQYGNMNTNMHSAANGWNF